MHRDPSGGSGQQNDSVKRVRVYQQWQGNERFFCEGYCVAGPGWKSSIGSVALIAVPSVVFWIWPATYMSQQITWAILPISIVLPCFCLSQLVMTACRDPGVLPRQEPDEEWLAGRKPRSKEVLVNGQRVQVRYNDTCHFYQPPRAHHCSVNDNCIERFDHHCPWVGTTIGLRNYRSFLMFVYATSVFIAWTFAICLWSLFQRRSQLIADTVAAGGDADSVNEFSALGLMPSPVSMVLMVYSAVFGLFLGGLSGFHTYLTATNQTTYENFRYNRSSAPNPYDVGMLRNCASVWCHRVPPSRVDFRAFVDEARKPKPVALSFDSYVGPGPSPLALQPGAHSYDSTMEQGLTPPILDHTPSRAPSFVSPSMVSPVLSERGSASGVAAPPPASSPAPEGQWPGGGATSGANPRTGEDASAAWPPSGHGSDGRGAPPRRTSDGAGVELGPLQKALQAARQ